jgi:predicted dehydrogenase
MANSQQLRMAILGAGIISQSIHIPSMFRAGITLSAVCDLSPSRAKEVASKYSVKGSSDPREILDDPDIDAVLIATSGSHAELTIAALKAGKHVLAEKPLALNSMELDAIEAAQKQSGKILQIGYMKMYDPLAQRAAQEIALLKDIRLVRVTVSHPADAPQIAHLRLKPPLDDADINEIERARQYEMEQTEIAFPGAPEILRSFYKNIIQGSLIHETSMLRGLGFELPTVWQAEVFPELSGTTPSSILAVGKVKDTRFILSWNWLPEYPEYDEELKVLASNGRVEYHLAKPYVLEERSRLTVFKHDLHERQDTTYTQINETGFLRQLLAFKDSVVNGTEVISNLAGVRKDLAVLQAITRSIIDSQRN